ncbi:hypothetical protein [Streptomyces sp. NPDC053813]|jgi:hypothetical protein|uniref:hypothetical protein n=1 Tax=Streptomyces sp. NPDC053813 TaxID=3365717 RepID=UPI0037CD1A5E
MRPISRFTAWATTLATAVGAMVVLAGSPASANGGYWSISCDSPNACLRLSLGRQGPGGPFWNMTGCGVYGINDFHDRGYANGRAFDVHYADQRWDRVEAWTSRGLDPNNRVTGVTVLC